MATWVTHLMIADRILCACPDLDRRGFYVGNIAPDCNVENEDWTAFIPPREVTHWMQGERKKASDCDAFCNEYILQRKDEITCPEEYGFLLGYYAHLIADAAFQSFIRDERRVINVWKRIRTDEALRTKALMCDESWDAVKKLIPKDMRMREISALEAEYLRENPGSGYLTEILPLKQFPDYIDYLPVGGIMRKIGVMCRVPESDKTIKLISISRDELEAFVGSTAELVMSKFEGKRLLQNI